ncbi:MAG: Hpt domain-containing protein [Deltaproteobacteria bacterium]|nr:Hpt domain-containing protein [Deltaproteobacteria bacterium]
MEEYGSLLKSIDGIASDFLFIDGKEIDVPAAGKLLNMLDELIKEAEALEADRLKQVVSGLSSLLEKIVLERIEDEEAGFGAFEKGVILMQEIGDSLKNTGGYEGNIETFMESIATLTREQGAWSMEQGAEVGDQRSEVGSQKSDNEQPATSNKQPATSNQQQATSNDIQDESLLRDFIVEGLEYIDEIEVNLLNLEQEPENSDCINAIFRPFHSIKGVASFLNLDQIRELAHSLETLLDKARSGELSVTSGLIDVILDGADALKAMIVKLRDDFGSKPAEPLKIDLPGLMARIESVEEGESDVRERKKVGEILIEEGAITQEVLKKELDVARQSIPPKKIGEALISEGKVTPKQVSQALRKQTEQDADTAVIRVNIKKLDDLIDMVGELVITQAMIRQNSFILSNSDRRLSRDVSRLTSITSELQRTSTSLRMIPIKQTFQRMSRLVRDLSRDAGKKVGVVTEGEDTEIDKNMVEEIYNPLVHMVRNAVDHGIDSSEERLKAGKPEKGIVRLKAFHRGGNIVIEISDDGKGLDRDGILKKAVEKKLIDSSHDLSDQDIYKLIFLPGFSTAAAIGKTGRRKTAGEDRD